MTEILSLHFLPDPWMRTAFSVALLVVGMVVLHLLTRVLLRRIVRTMVDRSRADWDDIVFQVRLPHRAAQVLPLLAAQAALPLLAGVSDRVEAVISRLLTAVMVVVVARAVVAAITAAQLVYDRSAVAATRPIKSYAQLAKVLVYLTAGIIVVAHLAGQTPWYLLSGLGAMTAVILLIFRDTLLSLVASVQIGNNDLLRVGDWIEMPQFEADGDVVDIALYTVKVQNWDKTITVVPTHKFLDHSFKNWRGMFDTGGRRIKRSININLGSIRFLTDEEVEGFKRFSLLRPYLEEKQDLLRRSRAALADGEDVAVNARRLTNLGTLRAYITAYLRQHPQIRQDLTFLVRQLAPTAEGVPLEIYVFSADTRWSVYEGIQADIFDHILAMMPEFDLRVYQRPSGRDFAALGDA